ncbi:MAG: hypothetical protein B6U89_07315 [Desulfurococcales archaeon ex4484_58]|nr:MAG: hypothetical protein B6U89_07315 [Desulfurococcales archaeon ex4484_58]
MLKLLIKRSKRDSPFKVRNKIELIFEENKSTIFVGLNASLKSITARSLGKWKPNLESIGISYEVIYNDRTQYDPGEWLLDIIEDSRLILRAWLKSEETLSIINRYIEGWKSTIEGQSDLRSMIEEFNKVSKQLENLLNELGLSFVNNYLRLKKGLDTSKFSQIMNILETTKKEVLEKIKGFGEELTIENLLPLDVEVMGEPYYGMEWIVMRDLRNKMKIKRETISSSVASALLFKYVAAFLSNVEYEKKLIIIEEPEEALAPLQQVLFMLFLDKTLSNSEELDIGENYVVITTHSPYIALAPRNKRTYYFSIVDRTLKIEESIPRKPFILGEYLLLKELE